jgi:hypothetical protein
LPNLGGTIRLKLDGNTHTVFCMLHEAFILLRSFGVRLTNSVEQFQSGLFLAFRVLAF